MEILPKETETLPEQPKDHSFSEQTLTKVRDLMLVNVRTKDIAEYLKLHPVYVSKIKSYLRHADLCSSRKVKLASNVVEKALKDNNLDVALKVYNASMERVAPPKQPVNATQINLGYNPNSREKETSE